MRIERTGSTLPITPRFEAFLLDNMGGVSLDTYDNNQDTRPDYSCLRGLLAIEIKSLEEDGSVRMENLNNSLRERPDWPVFFGNADVNLVARNTDDPEAVMRQVADRAGRAIKNHITKAHKQLKKHQEGTGRQPLVKVLILINEDNELYHPDLVGHIASRELRMKRDGILRRPHIDALLYLTERHATLVNNLLTYPIVAIPGPTSRNQYWKSDVVNMMISRWVAWNNMASFEASVSPSDFETIVDVPQTMTRSDRWRLDYRRKPYLAHLDQESFKLLWEEEQVLGWRWGLKGCPVKPSENEVHQQLERKTHFFEEINRRGICMTKLQSTKSRMRAAVDRLELPAEVKDWAKEMINLTGLQDD